MTTPWSNRVHQLEARWGKPGCIHYRKTLRDKIVELMNPFEFVTSKELLDVGCGSSVLYEHLPPKLKRTYTGVDFTPEFIELCRKRYPKGNWKVEDARNLSFLDDSFLLVNSTTVLQHIQEWKKAAAELVRVSRKYVLSVCRSHWAKTRIVATKPVLRRRFNPKDIIEFYQQYGEVTWQWVANIDGKVQMLGMYLLTKR